MSAEMLRRAAELMREQAEAARPTLPWTVDDENELAFPVLYMRNPFQDQARYRPKGGWKPLDTGVPIEAQAHILGFTPAAALAVADWLDGVAARWDRDGLTPERTHATAVARAHLGESA